MSTTLAALPAFPAPATNALRDGANPITLATLLRASLFRRTDLAALADLPPHLRADIGLPPAPEAPRLRTAAIIGW